MTTRSGPTVNLTCLPGLFSVSPSPKDQAGTKFRLRLLPDRTLANKPFGLNQTIQTVPANGVYEVTIRASDYGLSETQLHKIEQISVHSGADGFGSLGQDADKQATFEKIEKVTHRAGIIVTPQNVLNAFETGSDKQSVYAGAQLFAAGQNLSVWRGFVALWFLFAAGLFYRGIRLFNRRGQAVNLGVISMAIIAGLLIPVRMVSQTQSPRIVIPIELASSVQENETANTGFDRYGTDLTGYQVQAAIRGPRDRMVRWEFVAQNGDVTLLPPARNVRLNGNPQIITANLAEFNVDLTQGGRIRLSYGQLTDDGDTLNQTNAQPGEVVIRQFVLTRSARLAAAPVEPTVATPAPVVSMPEPAARPQASVPAVEAAAEVLAQGTSGSYTGTIGDYAVWTDGEFDLPPGTVLRITFPKDQAGTKFRLRLLPNRSQANQPLGLDRTILTVPANGVFEITIRAATFGLSEARLHHIEQISIHSGADGFGSLRQDADKQAVFEKVEKVSSSGRAHLPPPAQEPVARPVAAAPQPSQRPAANRQGFSMEFDGPANSKPGSTQWTYDLGAGGWGNNELETYTNSAENAHLDGQGHLVIRVVGNNGRYTSARLKTQGLITAQYGHLEARIKLPAGQGIWPAWWLLGNNFDSKGWPNAGELDIAEMRGREPGVNLGTAHGPGYSGGNGISGVYQLPDGQNSPTISIHLRSIGLLTALPGMWTEMLTIRPPGPRCLLAPRGFLTIRSSCF